MCGIAGIITFDGSSGPEPAVLERMVDAMTHRGPDDRGTVIRGRVGLGMRRLSIIDIEGGRQPIASEDGAIQLVTNGEIYSFPELRGQLIDLGHRFTTRSDVEVIVHGYEQWGIEGLLSRLNGMFAFALNDERRGVTYLVRDRLGVKPLVYWKGNGGVLFASGLSALLASGLVAVEPDPVGARLFMHSQFTPAPYTVLRDVKKLPPASYVEITENRAGDPVTYWQLPTEPDETLSAADWCDKLRWLIDDAVRAHMLSDVEVGAFLSGGIDSSVVVGLMSRHAPTRTQAFSVGVEGDDETPFARAAAERFGIELHHLQFGPKHLADVLDQRFRVMEEPIADPAVLPTLLLASEARRSVKVVLTGEGGDELFAGYDYYRRFLSGWQRAKGTMRRVVDRSIGGRRVAYRHRSYWSGFPYVMTPAAVEAFTRDLAGGDADRTGSIIEKTESAFAQPGIDGVSRALRVDTQSWLPDDLLMKVDRATMAFGLEARVPLLDYRVVELASRIPTRLKIHGGTGKWVFRSAFRDLIGSELADRGKMGFGVPLGRWFRGELRPLLDRYLGRSALEATPWLRPDAVAELVRRHTAGQADYTRPIWTLCVLAAWFRERAGASTRQRVG